MEFLIYHFNKDFLATVASEIMRRLRATSLAVGKVETEEQQWGRREQHSHQQPAAQTDGLQGPGSEQRKLHGHQARKQLTDDQCRRGSRLLKEDFEGDNEDGHGCWKIWSLRLRSRYHLPGDTDGAPTAAAPPGYQACTTRLKERCDHVASP